MQDVRDVIFQDVREQRFRAVLTAERSGVLSGVEAARERAVELGLARFDCGEEGQLLERGQVVAAFSGTPKAIAMAEEQIIGTLAKASGISTAARQAVTLAAGRLRIVSGSWKKMPPELKAMVRRAVATGGAEFRICEPPMLYIDKNFIRMLGSIPQALRAAEPLPAVTKVVQLKGISRPIEEETCQAVEGGARILMVDTGDVTDLERCQKELRRLGARGGVQVAFAGNVRIADIPAFLDRDIDILCIGKEIVDAGLLDMKLDVLARDGAGDGRADRTEKGERPWEN